MKKALITLTVVAWTVGLFIEMGWLALVILPIALIFMAATFIPLMVAEPEPLNEQSTSITIRSMEPAFGN